MTEYTTASEAVREFMSSRERTAYWVRTHSPTGADFYSPSALPSELPPTPTSPPSEIESSHSIPPKMVLKYKDGRPDIPISHWHHEGNNANRSAPKRSHNNGEPGFHEQSHGHTRSRSHTAVDSDRGRLGRSGSLNYGRQRELSPQFPHSPEEIRVWPSDSDEVPQTFPRSKSLPRDALVYQDRPPPPVPPLHPMYHPPSHHVQPLPSHIPSGPRIQNPRPRPVAWHSLPPQNLPAGRPPPAIIYAPSHHSKPHYSPPALYPTHHQGAEGMRQTRSAPVRYPGAGEPPFPLVHGTTTSLTSVNEERRSRKSASKSRPHTPSERDSQDSGSTYYVLPTPGQKVHIIAPDKSIYTATSTTKSPSSPSLRKPFFHRIFGMFSSTDSSKGSSSGDRRLQRRHSTGGRHRANERRAR